MARQASEYDVVHELIERLAGKVLHPKQVDSLAHAVIGAAHAQVASVHAIARAAARARNVSEKHSIKQVDRLLANSKVDAVKLMQHVVPLLVAGRPRVVVAIDWTDLTSEGHSTVTASTVEEGRSAMPLMWLTVVGKEVRTRRAEHEARLLRLLRVAVPNVELGRPLRDWKGPRFARPLSEVVCRTPDRRDRMLLVLALAAVLDPGTTDRIHVPI